MTKKRACSDVPIFLDERFFGDLQKIVEEVEWPYKTNMTEFHLRDQALVCFLILTGLRISEALKVRRLQIRVYPWEVVVMNVKTVKHGLMRTKIVCPKKGRLSWFSLRLEEWLRLVPEKQKVDSYVFPSGTAYGFIWSKPLGRKRAHWILKTTIDKFPHWFRSVTETLYGRLIFKNDAWKLKQFMGLQRLDSTTPYVKGSWEEDLKTIYTI